MTNGEGFFDVQAIFSQEYLVYFKEKWCRTAGKDPPLGHVDGFQIGPSSFSVALNEIKCLLRVKEALNKSPAADGGSFAPAVQFEKLEIHPVFLRFPNFHLVQNLSPSALVDFIRASLKLYFFQVAQSVIDFPLSLRGRQGPPANAHQHFRNCPPILFARYRSFLCHCEGACARGNLLAQKIRICRRSSIDVTPCCGDCHVALLLAINM